MQLTIIAALCSLLLGGAGGAAVAWKVKSGEVAIADNKELREQITQLTGIAGTQQQQLATQAASMDAAVNRLNGISKGREDDQNNLDTVAADLARDLAELRRANPAVAACELGDEFLRHWNKANGTGAGADPNSATEPAANVAGESDELVPVIAGPARILGRYGVVTARPGSADVSRLREPAGPPASSGDGVGTNQLAVVLPGAAAAVVAATEVRR